MHISDILNSGKTSISFEFFPPKTEAGSEKLYRAINELTPLKPSFVSVTYGAGGSTRSLTHDLVVKIQKELDVCVVSHLTCVGATKDEIGEVLDSYHKSGIRNIMALRGDPPAGQNYFEATEGGFAHATELVAYIKERFSDMGIGVAGYPEGHPTTPNRIVEMDHLKEKVDAGADYICTQLFFDNNDFFDFSERCSIAGIDIPVVAGIMPITSMKNMNRMAELAAGVRFPAGLLKSLMRGKSDEYVRSAGIHWAAEQVRGLLDKNVAGIHFYTLNNSKEVQEICQAAGISSSADL